MCNDAFAKLFTMSALYHIAIYSMPAIINPVSTKHTYSYILLTYVHSVSFKNSPLDSAFVSTCAIISRDFA